MEKEKTVMEYADLTKNEYTVRKMMAISQALDEMAEKAQGYGTEAKKARILLQIIDEQNIKADYDEDTGKVTFF